MYVNTPYVSYEVFKKGSLGFNSKFYTVYLVFDVSLNLIIKLDVIMKQNDGWIVSFDLLYFKSNVCCHEFNDGSYK